jgi:uncharacterized peroxidase-related enzyme
MPFIPMIDEARAQGELVELYDRIAGARGGVADVMRIQSLNPPALAAHFELYKTLLFGRSELDRRTREMIGVLVSATNECAYCVAHHSQPLRAYGVDEQIIAALAEGRIPEGLSGALEHLLSWVREQTATPNARRDAVDTLREFGWSDSAILDAAMITGYFAMVNRVVLALGVDIEPSYVETCEPDLADR